MPRSGWVAVGFLVGELLSVTFPVGIVWEYGYVGYVGRVDGGACGVAWFVACTVGFEHGDYVEN